MAEIKQVFTKHERYMLDHTCGWVKPYKNQPIDDAMIFCKEKGVSYAFMQQRETMIMLNNKARVEAKEAGKELDREPYHIPDWDAYSK